MTQITKADLTQPMQQLVELMQEILFGRIKNIHVSNGEPELTSETVIERDIKLGGQNGSRAERNHNDFLLKKGVVMILEHISKMGSGEVFQLEIKHGLPFLMRIEERAD